MYNVYKTTNKSKAKIKQDVYKIKHFFIEYMLSHNCVFFNYNQFANDSKYLQRDKIKKDIKYCS